MGRFSKCRVIFLAKLSKCKAELLELDSQSQTRAEWHFSLKMNKVSFQRCFQRSKTWFSELLQITVFYRRHQSMKIQATGTVGVNKRWNSYSVVKLLSACTYLVFYHNILKPPSLFYSLFPPSNFFFNLFSSPFHFSPHYLNYISPPHLSTNYYMHWLFLHSSLFPMTFENP